MGTEYSIRNQEGMYFLTSTVVEWIDVFSRKIYRDTIIDSFDYCIKNKGLRLHAFVIMTNHVHWIASAKEKLKFSDIVRDLKKHTSKEIVKQIQEYAHESRRDWMLNAFSYSGINHSDNKNHKFWQDDNHAMEIFSEKFFEEKLNYIHNNPVRAGWVNKPEDYIYSSAGDYLGIKGLLDLDLIITQQNVR